MRPSRGREHVRKCIVLSAYGSSRKPHLNFTHSHNISALLLLTGLALLMLTHVDRQNFGVYDLGFVTRIWKGARMHCNPLLWKTLEPRDLFQTRQIKPQAEPGTPGSGYEVASLGLRGSGLETRTGCDTRTSIRALPCMDLGFQV